MHVAAEGKITAAGGSKKKVASATKRRRPAAWILALSIFVVLAASLGYAAGRLAPIRPTPEGESVDESSVLARARPAAESKGLRFEDAVARSATPAPDSFRARLLQSGYFVDENHTLASVTLPTGEQVEIPIRQVNVRYLGNAAYQ